MSIVLETRRLVLCHVTMNDLDFITSMVSDPWVMRFYRKTYNRDEAARALREQLDRYARDGIGSWLAREKATGRPIGRAGLMRRTLKGRPETDIAWMIHRPYQRLGYASEAAAACRDYAFATLDLPRVIALVRPENIPSRGVATKIGMTEVDRICHSEYEHLVYAVERAWDRERRGTTVSFPQPPQCR